MGELVIVCCHAICMDPYNPHEESSWMLKPFQRSNPSTGKTGEHETFMLHIQAGLNALRREGTVLVFSGAQTEPDAPFSEAVSYLKVLMRSFGKFDFVQQAMDDGRILAEDAATDSYQNLLFSLVLYYEVHKEWPHTITVVTHAFKENRFLDGHAVALGLPKERIRVQGINPPFPLPELREVHRLEEDTVDLFLRDPHGTRNPLLAKRIARGWSPSRDVLVNIHDPLASGRIQRWFDRSHLVEHEPPPWVIE